MSTIVTRAGKGSALTYNEVDSNFINLNTDKIQSGNTVAALTITSLTAGETTLLGIAGEGGQISLNNPNNASLGMNIDVGSPDEGRIFTTRNNSTIQIGQLAGTGGIVQLFTAASERMRIDANGNVGIGTNSPTAKLEVEGGVSAKQADGRYFGFGTTNFSMDGTLVNDYGITYNQISSTFNTVLAGFSNIKFATGRSEKMRIDPSGNVGIGTSTPNASALLDVQSTTKGVRMPNMTTTQKNAITSPAAGLIIFDTTLAKLCVYTGAAWQTITSV